MEVKLEIMTDPPTNQQTEEHTDRRADREVSLPRRALIMEVKFSTLLGKYDRSKKKKT